MYVPGIAKIILFIMSLLAVDISKAADAAKSAASAGQLKWKPLPALPDSEGFAGSFAGTHNGALIVGGGANFPGKRPWEGGTKVWYDSVFILETPQSTWKTGFKLPRPLGYGVSLSCKQGVLCIGGSDAQKHSTEVFFLEWTNGKLSTKPMPALPRPCANMCGAVVDNTVYVAGGLESPNATNALKIFWSLDLAKPVAWRELEPWPWPGPGRMLATAGSHSGAFFLFGGAALKTGSDGKVIREWLRDAYCFTPGKGWKRLDDLPRATVAAPSPAVAFGDSQLLVLGGDDGQQVDTAPTEHRGFPRSVLAYDAKQNTWIQSGTLPFSLVTTPTVKWDDQIVVPGGEARPGIRSTEIWSGSTRPK